ncbi:hypothetical protein BIW11_04266 [Tropilaelaps mercedesae]|uniref:Uncharacterized protein n=1 Tax=Tropilaelaps mercedesae TaxID=418985 RepID=A0A1V9X912_9ACAR|nr:hypothetical protein BIW11_04266 [Tropilaelaps mercedesae]
MCLSNSPPHVIRDSAVLLLENCFDSMKNAIGKLKRSDSLVNRRKKKPRERNSQKVLDRRDHKYNNKTPTWRCSRK